MIRTCQNCREISHCRCWQAIHSVLCLVPGDNIRYTNLPHAREEGQCCEDQGRNKELPLVEEQNDAIGLLLQIVDGSVYRDALSDQVGLTCSFFLSSSSSLGNTVLPLSSTSGAPRCLTSPDWRSTPVVYPLPAVAIVVILCVCC